MEKNDIARIATDYIDSAENVLPDDIALRSDLAGMRFFAQPLIGYANADDALFEVLRQPGVVGSHFRLPRAWIAAARSVVSLFFPFSDQVVQSNRLDPIHPSPEWLHARVEGQRMINRLAEHIAGALRDNGYEAVYPSGSKDFGAWRHKEGAPSFTSNWSERHVAYVCGLGTFGLSAGLITEKGTTGRFCSLVTSCEFEPDVRPYSDPFEYCTRCNACARRCFVNAITPGKPKDKALCSDLVDVRLKEHDPRYGCGKCNVAVPCEQGIPGRKSYLSAL